MVKNSLSATAGMLLLPAMLVAACASGQSAGATGTPVSTPSASETPAVLPPALTAISPTPLPGTGGTETPEVSQVTLADNGTSVRLHVGQTFLLNLGDQYDWTVNVTDPSIVSRRVNITVIRGAQGVYDALKAGTTTLNASGDPMCRQSKPACAMPSMEFEVTVVVEP